MNVLRDTLVTQQVNFLARCTAATLGIAGFTLICWQSWIIALGLLLVFWGNALVQHISR